MKIDLHLHSKYSWDSKVEIEQYIKMAEFLKYGAISITDHNSIESHEQIKYLQKNTKVILIPGQEISTIDGHLLIYGWLNKIQNNLSMIETVELAHRQNGFCIAAHPFDFLRNGAFNKVYQTGIDGIEIFNASTWLGITNLMAKRSVRKRSRIVTIASSDSHSISEFGAAWTSIPYSNNFDEIFYNLQKSTMFGSRIGIWKKLRRFWNRKQN